MPKVPELVVIRHKCKCDTATEPPGDDGVEHVFTVDGAELPWYISSRGPVVTRHLDDLFSIEIEIICITVEGKSKLEFTTSDDWQQLTPIIGGNPFPWPMTEAGWTFHADHKSVPTITLAFFARNVDARGVAIIDAREVYDNHGDRWV